MTAKVGVQIGRWEKEEDEDHVRLERESKGHAKFSSPSTFNSNQTGERRKKGTKGAYIYRPGRWRWGRGAQGQSRGELQSGDASYVGGGPAVLEME